MPNDCWNNITITCENHDELVRLIDAEIKDQDIIQKRGANAVILRMWSPWAPPFNWLSELIDKYPRCWIKNEWNEEDGMTGVWIGFVNNDNEKTVKQMSWREEIRYLMEMS